MDPRHFTSEDWSDYLRGEIPAGHASEMRDHLDRSCEVCRQGLLETIRILENSRDEANYAPFFRASVEGALDPTFTEDSVRKDYRRDSRFARLTFDSTQFPAQAAVRSSADAFGSTTRHLLYDAAPYSVDVRIEQLTGLPAAELVGQILSSSAVTGPLEDIRIVLMRGKDVLSKTLANAFGEFQLQFEPGKNLMVVLRLPRETICMNLPDLDA